MSDSDTKESEDLALQLRRFAQRLGLEGPLHNHAHIAETFVRLRTLEMGAKLLDEGLRDF